MHLRKLSVLRFARSKKALALPITYMILFVSTLLLISVTYVIAIDQLNTQKQPLQELTAQQDMTTLADNVLSIASQPGSACTQSFRDSGGQLNVSPLTGNLMVAVTDNNTVNTIVYNQTTGHVAYNLASFASANLGFYLRGDSNTLTNQTGASPGQLWFSYSSNQPALDLQYRPIVTYAAAGTENGQAINLIRIYVINLNNSDTIAIEGQLPLKISCTNTQLTSQSFSVPYQPGELTVTSQLNSAEGSIQVPLVSTPQGAIINLEVVTSNVSIQRCIA
jgi:hypothetical protein